MSESKRREAYEFGIFAEEVSANEYTKKGYAILERRWLLGKTEIDLIAQKDDQIVIIEVKARKDNGEDPLDSVTVDKRRRMIKAADAYIRTLKGDYDYRFDIVTVSGNKEKYEINIFKDAFTAADLF